MSMEYKVVTALNGLRELEQVINKHMKEGWRLVGGLTWNQNYPYQALGRKASTEEKHPFRDRKKLSSSD